MKKPETISEAKEAEAAAQRHAEHLRKMRVPFPLAGEDAVFSFGIRSLEMLDQKTKELLPDYRDRGLSLFGLYEQLLLNGDARAIRAVLDAGLKRVTADGALVPAADIDLDGELEWPVSDIVEPALNALAYSHFKKTYAELLAEATAAREGAAEEARREWQARAAG